MSRSELSLARRALSVLAVAFVALALAPPAHAAEKATILFEYGVDRRTWYWEKQKDQEVTVPVPPGSPVEPSQRVRVPPPQRNDTLPVAVVQDDHERTSAIYFDLVSRGVTDGSTIDAFTMTIEESQDRNEWPSVSPDKAAIKACRISEFWPDSDGAEEWGTRPKFTESDCVDGDRDTKGPVPTWTFDLQPIADGWGKDPNKNYGVMLLGNTQKDKESTWQVNLKIPSRDNATTPGNEYQQTEERVVVEMAFVPGEPAGEGFDTGTGTFGTGSSYSGSTSFGSTGGSSFGSSGGSPVITGSSSGEAGTEGTASEAPATAPVAASEPPAPKLPPYVWLVLPIGLLGLAAVRSAILDPVGGTRPDGVIAAIRQRNIERRGGPLRELTDPWTRFATVSRRATASLRRGVLGVGRAVSKVLRRGGK